MIKVRAANGTEYVISWIGVATMDGALRFGVINANMSDVITTFINPENCSVIKRIFDEDEQTYEGYTVFRGVTMNYDGTIVVSLSKI